MKGILYINTDLFKDEILFERGLSLVSVKRREKVLNFHNSIPARLSLGAGVLLRIAMEKCNVSTRMDEISYTEFGKPYLENSDFCFSLSHSGKYAVCAYSDQKIGVDIQIMKKSMPKFTDKILSIKEKNYLMSKNEKERTALFFRLWARKESLIKWDGRGLRLPLNELSFIEQDSVVDKKTFDEIPLYFTDIKSPDQEYVCCVCSEADGFPSEPMEVDSYFLTKY